MGRRDGTNKKSDGQPGNEEKTDNGSPTQVQDGEASASSLGLVKVLEEIQDFRKDTKQQPSDIKAELTNVNTKIAEAETQIEKMEDRVQNVEQVLAKMMKVLTRQESKLLDQEGRSRWENIRIYNVPEGEEGNVLGGLCGKITTGHP